jgi:hypothetical protein
VNSRFVVHPSTHHPVREPHDTSRTLSPLPRGPSTGPHRRIGGYSRSRPRLTATVPPGASSSRLGFAEGLDHEVVRLLVSRAAAALRAAPITLPFAKPATHGLHSSNERPVSALAALARRRRLGQPVVFPAMLPSCERSRLPLAQVEVREVQSGVLGLRHRLGKPR